MKSWVKLVWVVLLGFWSFAEVFAQSDHDKYAGIVPEGTDPMDSLAYSLLMEHMKRPPSRISTNGEPLVHGYFIVDTHRRPDGSFIIPQDSSPAGSSLSSVSFGRDVEFGGSRFPAQEIDFGKFATLYLTTENPQEVTLAKEDVPPQENSTSEYGIPPTQNPAPIVTASTYVFSTEDPDKVSITSSTQATSQSFVTEDPDKITITSTPDPSHISITSTGAAPTVSPDGKYDIHIPNPFGNKVASIPQNSVGSLNAFESAHTKLSDNLARLRQSLKHLQMLASIGKGPNNQGSDYIPHAVDTPPPPPQTTTTKRPVSEPHKVDTAPPPSVSGIKSSFVNNNPYPLPSVPGQGQGLPLSLKQEMDFLEEALRLQQIKIQQMLSNPQAYLHHLNQIPTRTPSVADAMREINSANAFHNPSYPNTGYFPQTDQQNQPSEAIYKSNFFNIKPSPVDQSHFIKTGPSAKPIYSQGSGAKERKPVSGIQKAVEVLSNFSDSFVNEIEQRERLSYSTPTPTIQPRITPATFSRPAPPTTPQPFTVPKVLFGTEPPTAQRQPTAQSHINHLQTFLKPAYARVILKHGEPPSQQQKYQTAQYSNPTPTPAQWNNYPVSHQYQYPSNQHYNNYRSQQTSGSSLLPQASEPEQLFKSPQQMEHLLKSAMLPMPAESAKYSTIFLRPGNSARAQDWHRTSAEVIGRRANSNALKYQIYHKFGDVL